MSEQPGAKVVGTSGGDALAFKNADGSVVAILYSSSGGNQTVAAGGKKVSFSMSGGGWATVVVPFDYSAGWTMWDPAAATAEKGNLSAEQILELSDLSRNFPQGAATY